MPLTRAVTHVCLCAANHVKIDARDALAAGCPGRGMPWPRDALAAGCPGRGMPWPLNISCAASSTRPIFAPRPSPTSTPRPASRARSASAGNRSRFSTPRAARGQRAVLALQ
jgi:hypothetical protein